MKTRLNVVITGALLVLALSFPAAHAPRAQDDSRTTPADSALPGTFRSLRTIRGHFDGGPWTDTVDRWQGTKHRVMQRLAENALRERVAADQLRSRMGTPDETMDASAIGYRRTLEATTWQGTPAGALWVYNWRGRHDRLVIAIADARVVAVGWLYGLER